MSMLPRALERIDDRLDALKAGLVAALPPERVIDIGLVPYTERSRDQLLAGVWNIVPAGEGDYSRARGMAAREGTLKVCLVGHIQVDDGDNGRVLLDAEIELAEEIKAFVRTGVAGMSVVLDSIEQSRLLEHPYGWVVAFLELHPPAANTH